LCLAGLAGALGGGWAEALDAAQYLGAADALRAAIGAQWEPADRAEYERSVQVVRATLDDVAFAAAWSRGRTMTLAEAVDQARRLLAAPVGAAASAAAAARPRRAHQGPRLGGLTRREYEVALEVALGETNREIGDHLCIGEKTVEMHVSHSLKKLGLRSRAQLAAWVAAWSTSQLPSAGRGAP
ncbi:MAG: LuxR C-terminal-related transcriptional regulator, partial [Sphaerobacter sp.]|nr:LuxR C-terminal-related transcriptional regulator [Sphaerobacter sp.]